MDAVTIKQILIKAGYNVLDIRGGDVIIEDPTCLLRAFSDFIDFAGIAIGGVTMMLLFGWGIALIRGAKMDIIELFRDLFLLSAGLAIIPVLVNFLIGQEVWECKKIGVSVSAINKALSFKELDTVTIRDPAGGTFANISPCDRRVITAVNGYRVVDLRTVVSQSEIEVFQRVARAYGLQIRGCEREGCGCIGASREVAPFDHEGTDLYRNPGEQIPSVFNGVVTGVAPKYGGLWGMTVRNDNGTTAHYGYVTSNGLRVGDRVVAGQTIGFSQDLRMYKPYANVPNHVHFELWRGTSRRSGDAITAEGLF